MKLKTRKHAHAHCCCCVILAVAHMTWRWRFLLRLRETKQTWPTAFIRCRCRHSGSSNRPYMSAPSRQLSEEPVWRRRLHSLVSSVFVSSVFWFTLARNMIPIIRKQNMPTGAIFSLLLGKFDLNIVYFGQQDYSVWWFYFD